MKKILLCSFLAYTILSLSCLAQSPIAGFGANAGRGEYVVASPDGKVTLKVSTKGQLIYQVLFDGQQVILPSPVSLVLDDGRTLGHNSVIFKEELITKSRYVTPLYYKKNNISESYKELTLFTKGDYNIIFRVYNDGVAYRFETDLKKPFKVISEEAVFSFEGDPHAFIPYVSRWPVNEPQDQFYNSFENTYSHIPLSQWTKGRYAFLPLMVETAAGVKVCITEADLLNYPGMYLTADGGMASLHGIYAPYPSRIEQGGHNMLQGVVQERYDHIAECDGKTSFPWRVIVIADQDHKLADNDLIYLLSTPADPHTDYSWVRPGKVAWEWWNDWNLRGVNFRTGVNNETYQHYIDFASQNGIEYVILDEGWAVNLQADLMKVIPSIDLPMLVEYGRRKNVGIILWAGYLAFERDMENVCRHYSNMGIKGFKIDFMDRDDQPMVDFHRRAAQTAAKYRLMVDFHGTYKPTGLNRTYPNVVNYEGVHGLEQMKWSAPTVDQVTYDVTIPFIRMVAGPMDYTQGAMLNSTRGHYHPSNSSPMSQGTRCRQLAQYIIFESPLNMLCDSPSNYAKEPECTAFITRIPTVWDSTLSIDGKVGEYIVMAREKSGIWYIGGMTDWNKRDVSIGLSMLGSGTYIAEMYRDGMNADRHASDYLFESREVTSSDTLDMRMMPGGGFAVKIFKKY